MIIENLFPFILPVHLATLLAVLILIVRADHMGFSWMRGKVETLDAETLKKQHGYMWFGLSLMIISGATLAYPYTDYLLNLTPFLVKMFFVATLIVNGFAIGRLLHVSTKRPYRELTKRERLPLLISGAVSTACWIGAIIAATMINL